MASEEERAAILAEYKAAAAAGLYDDEDDEDEVDFDPYNEDDEDGEDGGDFGESDDDDNDDEDEAGGGGADHAVLNGTLHLNDEGRVIYSGTWCMKSQLDKEETSSASNNNNGKGGSSKKKHPKFKLKSQDVCHTSCDSPSKILFDVHRPTLTKPPPSGDDCATASLPTRRTMIFDGFFFEPPPENTAAAAASSSPKRESSNGNNGKHHHHHHHHPQGKKIKERDVEIFFCTPAEASDNVNIGEESAVDRGSYRVSGRGYNDYGSFLIDGTYQAPTKRSEEAAGAAAAAKGEGEITNNVKKDKHGNKGPCATVVCSKTYGHGGAAKDTRSGKSGGAAAPRSSRRRRRSDNDDDDSFDDDFDEKADYGEVNELCMDATMSIEELRKKYYGGGDKEEEEEVGDGGGKVAAAKRPRLDDSDDDECGF